MIKIILNNNIILVVVAGLCHIPQLVVRIQQDHHLIQLNNGSIPGHLIVCVEDHGLYIKTL